MATTGRTEDTVQALKEAIGARLARFHAELGEVCAQLGRDPARVKLIAVSKMHSASAVEAAMGAGIGEFGENRVQEAARKIEAVAPRPIWHLVGHLQTNKAGKAAALFDCVQSVDSVRLAQGLGEAAHRAGRKMDVLVQVNTTAESQKSGCDPDDLAGVLEAVTGEAKLNLRGLMTIGPLSQTEADTRRAFELAAELRETWRKRLGAEVMSVLSAGMSGDWAWALEYGADWVRVGTAIFGPREEAGSS